MNRLRASCLTLGGLILGTGLLFPAPADAIIIINGRGQVETERGIENPLVAFGFNPQPEPPASPFLADFSDPTRPVFTWSNASNHYEFIFGFNSGDPVSFDTSLMDAPNESGEYQFEMDINPHYNFSGDYRWGYGVLDPGTFNVFVPGSDQLPGYEGQKIGFAFDLIPDGSGNPTFVELAFRVVSTNPFENPVEFSIVPEPSTFVMLLLGTGGLAGYIVRRRRRRADDVDETARHDSQVGPRSGRID